MLRDPRQDPAQQPRDPSVNPGGEAPIKDPSQNPKDPQLIQRKKRKVKKLE